MRPAELLSDILDVVYAPICLGCERSQIPARGRGRVCGACRSSLRTLPPPCCRRCGVSLPRTGRAAGAVCQECRSWPAALRVARSGFLLRPPADRLIYQLKYRGWKILADEMADLLARVVERGTLPVDVRVEPNLVVPVPTTATRIRRRGYNQAELLARGFARHTGRTVLPLLARRGSAGTQTVLQPAARRANVAGSFHVPSGMDRTVHREHVILIDDVLTTGATAVECTRALIEAGARCVSVFTFARAETIGHTT